MDVCQIQREWSRWWQEMQVLSSKTIGIENGCSAQLIEGCAKKVKVSCFVRDTEDPAKKIFQLFNWLTFTCYQQCCSQILLEIVISYPEIFPCIFKDEIVDFYVTFKGPLDKPAALHFSYGDSYNKKPYELKIVVEPSTESDSFIDRMGHFK